MSVNQRRDVRAPRPAVRQGTRRRPTERPPRGEPARTARHAAPLDSTGIHRRGLLWYTSLVRLIEAVPNVSEGRRSHVIQALTDALADGHEVDLLDRSSDSAHNRTVFTLVGTPSGLIDALLALFEAAVDLIDLRTHEGEHPRIGAVDVVPLVPLDRADMPLCVSTAIRLGKTVAARFGVPVYLYEAAARVQDRRPLESVRRGGFERLAARMRMTSWRPDFGPAHPHPSAGASAIGARHVLIAFNVNLETGDLELARHIARTIRTSSGGMAAVKAIGVRTPRPDVVQVSVNLTDYEVTPLHAVFDAIEKEALRHDVAVRDSELVGLAPLGAIVGAAAHLLRLDGLTIDRVLECRLPR